MHFGDSTRKKAFKRLATVVTRLIEPYAVLLHKRSFLLFQGNGYNYSTSILKASKQRISLK